MADKNNISIEDILNEYAGKTPSKEVTEDSIDIDDLIISVSGGKTREKTEMIEDVLEIGDNSFVFDPEDVVPAEGEESAPEEEIPLEFKSISIADETKPEAEAAPVMEPSSDDIPVLRQGKKTTHGTQAIEQVLSTNEPKTTHIDAPKEEATKEEAKEQSARPKRPEIKAISEEASNTAMLESLKKLKRERGTPKVTAKIPPVNRASIDDIELDIEKKVIPNTEIGLDENATEEERLAYLNAKRRERVKQFVISGEEEEIPDKDAVADFVSFEQASEMAKSIASLKGNIVVRVVVLLITAFISGYITLANDLKLPLVSFLSRAENSATAFLFVNVVLGLAACAVSLTVISVGLKKLFTMKADSDSLATVSILFSMITGIALLTNSELVQMQYVQVYICVSILGLLINTIGKLLIVTRTERNFRYISGGYSKYAAMHITDEEVASKFTKGALSDFPSLTTARKTEFVSDFIKNSYSADLTDSFCKYFVPVITGISVIVGVIGAFVHPETISGTQATAFYAMSVACGTISMCSAVGMMLVTNIPLAKASKKYLQSSAVMLGYSAVEEFSDTNSVLIDAVDLFPDGMVDIVNIKPAKKTPIEEGILYAASLCCQTESILRSAFYKMIKGKTEMLYPVESYIYEDGLGLSGWIQNKRVLFGNRALMESHSIEGLPSLEKEEQYKKEASNLLYLSIGGTLAMLFIVQIRASVSIKRALKDLERQGITVILRSVDSSLSITRLAEMFDVSPNIFKLLPFRFHSDYDAQTSYISKMTSPMIYSGHFSSLAMLLSGTKKLLKSATMGVTIQTLSAVLGIVLAVVMTLIGNFSGILTGTVVLVYNIVFAVITAITQSVSKT